MTQTLKNYWKSILVTLFTLYLSFVHPSGIKKFNAIQIEHLDKVVHLFMYGALTLMLYFEYKKAKPNAKNTIELVLICVIYPIVLGGLVELAQEQWFSPRTAEWIDWMADIVGTVLSLVFVFLYHKIKNGTWKRNA